MKNHFVPAKELLMQVFYGVQVMGIVRGLRHSLQLRKLERRFGRKEVKRFCWKIGFS